MSNKVFGISVDCADAARVAQFWGEVLGRQVADGATSENAVLPANETADGGPRLSFHQVPEGKVAKNRLHLDLISDNLDSETVRLLALGAQKLRDFQGVSASWTTFADIEGNEFDVVDG
jgi:predicted enzyme related to lactoylglutathione lyase